MIAVPCGAVCQVEGVGVTVPTEMPDPLRTALTRLWTSVRVFPGTTAMRHPSRAAFVSNCATIPNRDASICPMIRATNTGATIATTTEADELLLHAKSFLKMVEEWIETTHPMMKG